MEKIKPIETVTELVNRIFSAYGVRGLDWEEKINEYADVVNELIDFDTDLTDLYKKIRLEFAKLPQPSTLKKMLSKSKTRAEVKEQIEHPDNGKLIVVTCYKDNLPKECRSYIVSYDAKPLSETTKHLREIYDDIKVFEFSKDSTLFSRYIKSEKRCTGEVWTPIYNAQAEVESYKKIKVA